MTALSALAAMPLGRKRHYVERYTVVEDSSVGYPSSLTLSLILAVSCLGQASGQSLADVSLESPAKVGLPVWLKISTRDEIRYPFFTVPDWHVCHDVEVRKGGKPFLRIQPPSGAIGIAVSFAGNICGNLYLPGKAQHPGSIPLHLMYRFDQPGIYEVRYVKRVPFVDAAPPAVVSPWTPIEIQPATPADRAKWLAEVSAHAPSDATSLLSGYLPDILGVPDERSLELVVPYLYHPDNLVRQYVAHGLAYWPGDQAKKAVLAALRSRGPSEDSARVLSSTREKTTADEEEAVQIALPYLKSDNTILLKGAIDTVAWIGLGEKSQISGELKTRAEGALIDAVAHVVALGNPEIANVYAGVLGTVKDERAAKILWTFVDRDIARGQAIIALTWLHAPSDLKKLAQLALPPAAEPGDAGPSSLPYALRNAYGEAALPYIEEMLQRSPFVWVRAASARELVEAGKPSGFAFIVDAIEQNRPYRGEMVQFLRDRFPEIGRAGDDTALNFAKGKANAK